MSIKPNELKDSSIRNAYKDAVGGKDRIISANDSAKIIRAALDKKKVTRTERRDLQLILQNGRLSETARSKLQDFQATRFVYLKSDARNVVAGVVGSSFYTQFIDFTFEDNRYLSSDYSYIAKKIRDGDIDTYSYSYTEDLEVSSATYGLYNSIEDELYIAEKRGNRTDLQRHSTIIHEATHAIQDKQNKSLQVRGAEAGAHIAQAIMLITVGKGTAKLLYGRLKKPGIRDAALKIFNGGDKENRGKLTKKERENALDVIDKDQFYGAKSKKQTSMDAEWYSFFESLAYTLSM